MPQVRSSLGLRSLADYCCNQINYSFPDEDKIQLSRLECYMEDVFKRVEHCFSHIDNKYFFDGKTVLFNHLHGDQYATFLYMLSREMYTAGEDPNVCEKLFLLNKKLHGLDLFYEVEMPAVFLLVHPLGTVLGRANYSDFLLVYQRCGVGSNRDEYPSFGKYLTLRPGSSILGAARTGENCQLASNSLVIGTTIPSNTTVFGGPSNLRYKQEVSPPTIWRKV